MIKTITKLSFIALILVSFNACNDNKKETEYKSALPIPEWDKKAEKKIWHEYKNWHDAKKNPISATKIGYAYSEELKDYKKAFEWFKYSDSMKPMPENSNYACYALQQLKKYKEAIKWCEKAISLGSDEALFRMGKVKELNHNYKEAISFYKQAYEKMNDTMAISNIGASYFELKDYNNAEIWYKKAIKEGNLQSYQNIATFYHDGLKDDIKASAYAIAVINTKYTKKSVLKLLQKTWKIPNETIKKGYELQLTSPEFPVKYKGDLGLEE